jgi:Holliday junction resolvasome RuvABC endonuclease subunit
MSRFTTEFTRALAVDIASRGLGFALLEGPLALIDRGFYNARADRDERCVTRLVWMLTKFKPDVLVIEDFGQKTRRPARVKALAEVFAAAAKEHGIACHRISRKTVKSRFPTCRDRYEIARALAERFPEIKPLCPPARKIWKSEDPRINIFDALSFAVTHLALAKKRRKRPVADNKAGTEQDR